MATHSKCFTLCISLSLKIVLFLSNIVQMATDQRAYFKVHVSVNYNNNDNKNDNY